MLFDHHHVFDKEAIPVRHYAKHPATLALVFTGDDFDGVVTLNLDACHN
jgi:hypothetical protein